MNLVRRVARPLLASTFVASGLDALGNPDAKAPGAERISPSVASSIPVLRDQDPRTLVILNGAVHVGAGVLLASGRLPRLSALALAAALVPTTLSEHRFWEHDDATSRHEHQVQLTKNLSLLGGLLLAAVDTGGKPGIAWRTRHASEHAGAAVRRSRREARAATREARAAARVARVAAKAKGAQIIHNVAA